MGRGIFADARDARYCATSGEDNDSEAGSDSCSQSSNSKKKRNIRCPSLGRVVDILATALIIFSLNVALKFVFWPQNQQNLGTFSSNPGHSAPSSYGGLTVEHDEFGAYVECPHDDTDAALAANCSFDLLANGWTPSPCFDAEMNHHFVDGQDFTFSSSSDGQHRISQQTILKGNLSDVAGGLWVSWDEHVHHCRYLVNGSISALADQSKGILDIWLDGGHMRHCLGALGKDHPAEEIDKTVKAVFWYRRCYLRHQLTNAKFDY